MFRAWQLQDGEIIFAKVKIVEICVEYMLLQLDLQLTEGYVLESNSVA
jgi:hypothetical protein